MDIYFDYELPVIFTVDGFPCISSNPISSGPRYDISSWVFNSSCGLWIFDVLLGSTVQADAAVREHHSPLHTMY